MSERIEVLAALQRAGYSAHTARAMVNRIESEAVAAHGKGSRPESAELTRTRADAHAQLLRDAGEERPVWRVIYTDSESPSGIAPVCNASGTDDQHNDIPIARSGTARDDEGVYDCCPFPQVETYSVVYAAYLVALLNDDAEDRSRPARPEPLQLALGVPADDDQRHPRPCEFPAVTPCTCPVRPRALPEASLQRAKRRARIAAFFRGARAGRADAATRRGAA